MVRLNLKDSIQCIIKYQHQPISIPTITNRIDRRMEARMSPRKPSIAKTFINTSKIRKERKLSRSADKTVEEAKYGEYK